MILKILGTVEEKQRVVEVLRNEKIIFDFLVDIPAGTKLENVHLWSTSGKGK